MTDTDTAIRTAQRRIQDLRRELNAAEADLALWAAGAPALDHSKGLRHAADAHLAVGLAFTLLRIEAWSPSGPTRWTCSK